jgi:hypothetical protein
MSEKMINGKIMKQFSTHKDKEEILEAEYLVSKNYNMLNK